MTKAGDFILPYCALSVNQLNCQLRWNFLTSALLIPSDVGWTLQEDIPENSGCAAIFKNFNKIVLIFMLKITTIKQVQRWYFVWFCDCNAKVSAFYWHFYVNRDKYSSNVNHFIAMKLLYFHPVYRTTAYTNQCAFRSCPESKYNVQCLEKIGHCPWWHWGLGVTYGH